MKIKTTKKNLNRCYNYIVRAGYCEFQTLLRHTNAREKFYASGVYGWNWDAYEIEATDGSLICVCTGYRDMTGERLQGLEKFEKDAQKIWSYENKKTYEEKQKAHERLLKRFADFVIKNYKN